MTRPVMSPPAAARGTAGQVSSSHAAGSRPISGYGCAGQDAGARAWFQGALLPVYGFEVLLVVVQPWVLAAPPEANLFAAAFQRRFRRPVVLVAQDERGNPYFYGDTAFARALSALPLPLIPWRRYLYRPEARPTWQLPIPPEDDQGAPMNAAETRAPRDLRDLRSHRGGHDTCALEESDDKCLHTTRR